MADLLDRLARLMTQLRRGRARLFAWLVLLGLATSTPRRQRLPGWQVGYRTPWSVRLVGLVSGTVAGVLAFVLMAGVLGGPAARHAASAVEFRLQVPVDASLPDLEQRSFVFAADGSVLAVLHAEIDRGVITLDRIPTTLQEAVITAEDRRFYSHDGYDVEGIGRALLANVRARDIVQGGSTITQQLAKNNFTGGAQTLDRKISELLYSIALEEHFTKDELLERYLNQVYFGWGAYGVVAASEEYFGVSVTDLSVEQAALLAGLIRSPSQYDPRRNPEAAKARRDQVLANMAVEGYLDASLVAGLQDRPVAVTPHRENVHRQPYVVEAVKREFFDNPAFGNTRAERIQRLFSGGLQIYTTIEPTLQAHAEAVVAETFDDPDGPTAAIAAVDPASGSIRALYSGADFNTEQFDLALQGRRQAGSAFKPFVLAAALSQGFPLDVTLEGSGPVELEPPGAIEPWTVSNYGGASYGRVTLRQALVRSVNTAFAQLVLVVGPENVAELAARMGVDIEAATGPSIPPAIALGGLEFGVTPLEMASAFSTFANGGAHVQPHLIDRVVGGGISYEATPEPEQVLHPAVNAAMVDVMQDVVRGGTGTRARLQGWEVAGKTGTTQRNQDAWFVGYTAVLSTAVWVGHPDAQIPMPGMTGGSLPAIVWREFMTLALADVEPVDFPEVDADLAEVLADALVEVPDVRRMNETEALSALLEAKLIADVRPVDSYAARGTVVWQSPRAGESVRAGTRVVVGVSTGNPPPPEPTETPTKEPTEPADSPAPAPPPPPPPEEGDDEDGSVINAPSPGEPPPG